MDNYVEYFSKSRTLIDFLNTLHTNGVKGAYIFNSFDEVKNFNSALLFSMIINCENESKPCLKCSSCVKQMKNTALDLNIYPKNNSIVVEDIENIIENVYVVPNEFKYKVYILKDFESANLSSQNKFLKTLEEPPKNVVFILTTNNLDKVLDTIKSRSEIINLPKVNENELKAIFGQDLNIRILENSYYEIGKFLKHTKEENFEDVFNFCLDLLENMNASTDLLKYASAILKDKANLETYYLCLINLFRDLTVVKLDESLLINKSEKERLKLISEGFKGESLKNILDYLIKANNELNFNANKSLVVDCLLLKIVEEKNIWKKKL